jgi:hypothetical protein
LPISAGLTNGKLKFSLENEVMGKKTSNQFSKSWGPPSIFRTQPPWATLTGWANFLEEMLRRAEPSRGVATGFLVDLLGF